MGPHLAPALTRPEPPSGASDQARDKLAGHTSTACPQTRLTKHPPPPPPTRHPDETRKKNSPGRPPRLPEAQTPNTFGEAQRWGENEGARERTFKPHEAPVTTAMDGHTPCHPVLETSSLNYFPIAFPLSRYPHEEGGPSTAVPLFQEETEASSNRAWGHVTHETAGRAPGPLRRPGKAPAEHAQRRHATSRHRHQHEDSAAVGRPKDGPGNPSGQTVTHGKFRVSRKQFLKEAAGPFISSARL